MKTNPDHHCRPTHVEREGEGVPTIGTTDTKAWAAAIEQVRAGIEALLGLGYTPERIAALSGTFIGNEAHKVEIAKTKAARLAAMSPAALRQRKERAKARKKRRAGRTQSP